jgi:hypothetical protein
MSDMIKNYEFELNHESHLMALHMMDRADKYLNRICDMDSLQTPQVLIQGPENLPADILNMIESAMQSRFSESYRPKQELHGVISVKLHNTYTIVFELAKLWFDQKSEEVQDQIIDMMGLESDYLELDWAEKQWNELKAADDDQDDLIE